MKPTLLILAAGLGSRYGGLKQIESFGPNGETIMDYSVYDAIKAGFGRVVFVIRHDFEQEFRDKILSKYDGVIDTAVVFQESTRSTNATKPWGTGHAILAAYETIKEPFFEINADDFYGLETFKKASEFLTNRQTENEYAVITYKLGNTLSDSGGVNRGVCEFGPDGNLVKITENKNIVRADGKIKSDQTAKLDENTPVSMNTLCFTPDFLEHAKKYWNEVFYPANKDSETAEFGAPTLIDHLIKTKTSTVTGIMSTETWYGVTYTADRPSVVKHIIDEIAAGTYPNKLF